VENVKRYQPGGFHPVHLGDTFHNNRYTVVYKLGHGSYSTPIRACSHEPSSSTLKIVVLESTKVASEIAVFHHLQQLSNLDIDNGNKDFVVYLLDKFKHHGPNGMHQCIVTEVLGPCLGLDDCLVEEHFNGFAKHVAAQISRGLRYLHKHFVVHGG
ncbi:hypothetical protein BDP27DRAFT_1198533, partial [Rhodocollybia butyracea]